MPHETILKILERMNKKRVNFFIDLQSICKGFYNKDIVMYEISEYATNNAISDKLITELKEYLNGLYFKYKPYDPFFVIFYDDGYNSQAKTINTAYKSGRTTLNMFLDSDHDAELFRQIKKYYFERIAVDFKKPEICEPIYLRQWESDMIPHYCIMNNLFDSHEADVLNIILSTDKDLLQSCKYPNTIQVCTTFRTGQSGKKEIHFGLYDKNNAPEYVYENFKKGIVTAEHIPLILAIAGDDSDNIKGIKKGIGKAHAIKMIEQFNIPTKIHEIRQQLDKMPEVIQEHFDKLCENLKLIDFEEQITRVPQAALKI
jgi:hypothetical protein